jgi:hypothetical protein
VCKLFPFFPWLFLKTSTLFNHVVSIISVCTNKKMQQGGLV